MIEPRWVPVPSEPGLWASLDGQIRGRKMHVGNQGYRVVRIGNRTRYVHQLVCETFHGRCPPGYDTRHLNGDKLDNRASNLAWATHAENMADMTGHGRGNGGKTHCPRGHEYTPENTYIWHGPTRHFRKCRTCERARHRRRREQRRCANDNPAGSCSSPT